MTKQSEGAAKEETRCDQVNKVLMEFFSPGFSLVAWILVLNFFPGLLAVKYEQAK